MTSRTFAMLFALAALAAVALPTSAQQNALRSSGTCSLLPVKVFQPCTPPSTGSGQKVMPNGTGTTPHALSLLHRRRRPVGMVGCRRIWRSRLSTRTSCRGAARRCLLNLVLPITIILPFPLLRVADPRVGDNQIGSAIPSREAGQKVARIPHLALCVG